MDLGDHLSVETPEGVILDLTLAGLGTRSMAAIVDGLIQGFVAVAAFLAGAGLGLFDQSGLVSGAFITLSITVVLIGYPVVFETLAGGRTPGKMAFGIRVAKDSGVPVDMWSSLVRNLVRLIDFLPSAYLAGVISIVATKSNQRLGDLAAGTVVLRYRAPATTSSRLDVPTPDGPPWDVSRVTDDDLIVIRRFFERRRELAPASRADLAGRIAKTIVPKIPGVDQSSDPESVLWRVLAEKTHPRP
jgi:uncharacterized RDD family membrane protein YckC